MSNKSSFDFYCLWEELSNPNFKLAESREFKKDSATQSFTMSPSRWIKETNAIAKEQYVILHDSNSIEKIKHLDNNSKKKLLS